MFRKKKREKEKEGRREAVREGKNLCATRQFKSIQSSYELQGVEILLDTTGRVLGTQNLFKNL